MTTETIAMIVAPWAVLVLYGTMVFWISPAGVSAARFVCGGGESGNAPTFWVLVFSGAITWIFVKSIDNAANLDQAFGITGGIGYRIYCLSFAVVAITIYFIRKMVGINRCLVLGVQIRHALCAAVSYRHRN